MAGKIPYENTFEVFDHIQGYDLILGTDFLQNTEIFNKIYNDIASEIGADSTTRNF